METLDPEDSVTLLQSIRMKHPVIHDINCLGEAEQAYDEMMEREARAHNQREEMREALWKADVEAKKAIEAELAARAAFDEAQRKVIAARHEVMEWNRQYTAAQTQEKRTTDEVERAALRLERKQERVRMALRRKEEELLDLNVHHSETSLDMLGWADLERLRKEEAYLRAESNRLDDRAKQLRSRSRKLKRRAEGFKEMQWVESSDAKGYYSDE